MIIEAVWIIKKHYDCNSIECCILGQVMIDIGSLREILFFSLSNSGHPKLVLFIFCEIFSSRF